MRVMVLGNAGSGKTTLAREIGADFGLPVFSLDTVVWQRGWQKTPLPEKNAAIQALIRKPVWVIDGVSEAVEQAADAVIFLDLPWPVCLWRCVRRTWRYLFRSRPDLPDECPERKIAPRLWGIIRRFDAHVRPGIVLRMDGDPRYVHVARRADYELVAARLAEVRSRGRSQRSRA